MDYYGFTLKELGLKHSPEELEEFIGSAILEDFYEKLVIIGFPYDHIVTQLKDPQLRIGAHYGPDSWRRFIHTVGVLDNREYGIKIGIKIADYGNIVAQNTDGFSLDENLQKLFIKSLLTFERNQVNFVMGGTRDFTPYVSKALISHAPYNKEKTAENQTDEPHLNKCLIISLNHSYDNSTEHSDMITPFNRLRSLQNMDEFKSSGSKLILIGPSELNVDLESDHFSIITNEMIENDKIESENEKFSVPILTQKGKYFNSLLKSNIQEYDYIQVDLNVESVQHITGVTTKGIEYQPFTTEEVIEIMFL